MPGLESRRLRRGPPRCGARPPSRATCTSGAGGARPGRCAWWPCSIGI